MGAPSPLAESPPAASRASDIAAQVRAQLKGDYPADVLAWVDGLTWTGPAQVPVSQVDRSRGTADWSAAAGDTAKLALFKHKIAGGFRKPVVLVRTPGSAKLLAVDGHTRTLACLALGQPVTAWVGTAKTAHGPWEALHSRQFSNDSTALNLASAPGLTSRSGMISLDLPDGTIKPVPGGLDDHHVTVVYLGPDLDDGAFDQACARVKDAAAQADGPLTGTVSGVSSFKPSPGSDGKVPAFAPVAIPGAQALRSKLQDLSASEHKDWVPHVTLAYISKGDPLPDPVPPTPVRFTHLSVHRGDEVRRFPLGSGSEHSADGARSVIELVGPKGFIHGWIFVGIPARGDEVSHPRHGAGTVTDSGGGRVAVRFATGHEQSFPVREDAGPGRFERMSEEELASELGHGTGQRHALALAELVRRDDAERAGHVSALYRTPLRTPADREKVYAGLVKHGENPEDAWAHAHGTTTELAQRKAVLAQLREEGYRGANFDAITRDAYRHELHRMTLDAEAATNGYMLNAAGRKAGIDPWSLMTGTEARARAYASHELKDHWDKAGRLTVAEFQRQLTGHASGLRSRGGNFLQ